MSGPDALLGGRVRLDQDAAGLRAAIEPVLLAAAVPARTGDAVLEAGAGVGAASLCLLARVEGARAVGLERDEVQAAAAERNAALNGWEGRFRAIAADLGTAEAARRVADAGPFDHAMANPPWHSGGTAPAVAPRRAAKHAEPATPLALWVAFLARRVRPRGSVTVILPAAMLPEAVAAARAAGLGSLSLFPFWPRSGEAARRVIVAGRKGGRGAARLLPGLVLHRADGRYTDEAEAVLRHAAALTIA